MPPELTGLNLNENNLQGKRKMAYDFWERVAADEQISDEFKAFLGHGNPIEYSR